jgi:protein AFG1
MAVSAPRGLLVHGPVGCGKSMLLDMFVNALPVAGKQRWHFGAFMLWVIGRLEAYRTEVVGSEAVAEFSLLRLARELVETSPVLFVDEFQMPDRMAAKTLSALMAVYFRLGGVLVATSNRLPDELAKAAGMEYGVGVGMREGKGMPANMEFAGFLELLRARCEVWEVLGVTDYRRVEFDGQLEEEVDGDDVRVCVAGEKDITEDPSHQSPTYYIISEDTKVIEEPELPDAISGLDTTSFNPTAISVYGRNLAIPRYSDGVSLWRFDELCSTRLGPADYISLASKCHTFIITGVPVLTSSLKNEARRFITLLDALYESRCRLFIQAAASPDTLFFPDVNPDGEQPEQDAIYAETFAEMHQDATSPFRPNISSYTLAEDAMEDDPPNRLRREAMPGSTEMERLERLGSRPNFADAAAFTGEDEKFAYKRAVSRLWEVCSTRWWENAQWAPLPADQRHWEKKSQAIVRVLTAQESERERISAESIGLAKEINELEDEVLFRHGASPFRTDLSAPPKIQPTHIWGLQEWGKKAGAWGKGVKGLDDRDRKKR